MSTHDASIQQEASLLIRQMNSRTKAQDNRIKEILPVLALVVIISYAIYGLFHAPGLFIDDWAMMRRITINLADQKWLDLGSHRPLTYSIWLLQCHLFGPNLIPYYLVLGALHIFRAALTYAIVSRLPLIQSRLFGLAIALLFLAYPIDYSHTYLITTNIQVAACLTLLYGYFLQRFASGDRWVSLGIALLCLVASLGFYEAQVGIVCAWPLVLALIYRPTTALKRLGLLVPIILVAAYAIYRVWGLQTFGAEELYLPIDTLAPGPLLERMYLGYKVSLVLGWVTTLQNIFPAFAGKNEGAFLALAAFVLILLLLSSWILFRHRAARLQQPGASWLSGERWSVIRPFLIAAFVGLLLVGAGYVPIILAGTPNLSGMGQYSHMNFFASLGGAVVVASALMAAAIFFSRAREHVGRLFLISVVPFLLLGIVTQAWVQYDVRSTWQEQTTIWQELFAAAPDFVDDTTVVLVLPGYEDRVGYQNWRRTPLLTHWEVTSALQVLYDNKTLAGDVIFPDITVRWEPILNSQGILRHDGVITPYAQSLFYSYDGRTGTLRRLDQVPVELAEESIDPIDLNAQRVLSGPRPGIPIRRLVRQ